MSVEAEHNRRVTAMRQFTLEERAAIGAGLSRANRADVIASQLFSAIQDANKQDRKALTQRDV